jgi:hypothetical protein
MYDGREKGDLSKTVFDLPDLMQRFADGKAAFIANQQYRAHHIGSQHSPPACALQQISRVRGRK